MSQVELPQLSEKVQDAYPSGHPRRRFRSFLTDANAEQYIAQIREGKDLDNIGIVIDTFLRLYYLRQAAIFPDNINYRQTRNTADPLNRFKQPKHAQCRYTSNEEDTFFSASTLLKNTFGNEHFVTVLVAYVEAVSKIPHLQAEVPAGRRSA